MSLDPVLLAVIANRMDSIVREMENTLLRSGRSAVLNQARDFSCALVTGDARLLASAEGLPVHVIGMEFLAQAVTDLHDDISDGDAFLHNDPYLGNTHPADHVILVPIIWEGVHLFTAAAKAHQADCGNSQPTTYMPYARDVYEEGSLIFPAVRVQRDFKDIDDIIRMCRRRIRVPEQWYGDYLAMLGAARIGEARLKELCAKYGRETLSAFVEEWFDYSENRIAHVISNMRKGVIVGSGCHDPFGPAPDGIPINVTVTVDPDAGMIEIDLTDNIDCLPAGLNESRTCAMNNCMTGVFNSIDPDIPHNAGTFRRVQVKLRENCVVGIPTFPHSCSVATTNVGERLVVTTQRSIADAWPGYGLAEGACGIGPGFAVVSGTDYRKGDDAYVNQKFLGSQGGPAGPDIDGWVTYGNAVTNGLMFRDSVEIDELKYPIRVREIRIRQDSEGAGRRRGAPGAIVAYGPKRDTMTAAYVTDGHFHPPRGTQGGGDGASSEPYKLLVDGTRGAAAADLPGGHPARRDARPSPLGRWRLRRPARARARAGARRRALRLHLPRARERRLRGRVRRRPRRRLPRARRGRDRATARRGAMTTFPGNRLDGKVAIVTGASSGIGAAIAEAMAQAGANVVLVGRDADRLARASPLCARGAARRSSPTSPPTTRRSASCRARWTRSAASTDRALGRHLRAQAVPRVPRRVARRAVARQRARALRDHARGAGAPARGLLGDLHLLDRRARSASRTRPPTARRRARSSMLVKSLADGVRPARRACQRDRPGQHPLADERGVLPVARVRARDDRGAPRPAASASSRTSPRPSSSWPRRPPATSTASRCSWTAAGRLEDGVRLAVPAWFPREAVQASARVNVTCVTPLGEEVASTS